MRAYIICFVCVSSSDDCKKRWLTQIHFRSFFCVNLTTTKSLSSIALHKLDQMGTLDTKLSITNANSNNKRKKICSKLLTIDDLIFIFSVRFPFIELQRSLVDSRYLIKRRTRLIDGRVGRVSDSFSSESIKIYARSMRSSFLVLSKLYCIADLFLSFNFCAFNYVTAKMRNETIFKLISMSPRQEIMKPKQNIEWDKRFFKRHHCIDTSIPTRRSARTPKIVPLNAETIFSPIPIRLMQIFMVVCFGGFEFSHLTMIEQKQNWF